MKLFYVLASAEISAIIASAGFIDVPKAQVEIAMRAAERRKASDKE
jgi:hypothetical protein